MDRLLDQEQLQELVSLASEKLGIRYPVIIEKDYYVTRVIHAISGLENEYFRLIFAGGTCLAKAHKIVKRMSEDVDFKIQTKEAAKIFTQSRLLRELKKFRSQIMSALILPDLAVGQTAVRNGGRYLRVDLNYHSLFSASETLRPHLLLEFTLSNIRLSTDELSVDTLIESTLDIEPIFEPKPISCISVQETAIEKWVGLTRRVAAIQREYHRDDSTLVRHIYDLNAIKDADKINGAFFDLAKNIIDQDAKQFSSQHPEYSANPVDEIFQSLNILKKGELWKKRYQNFIDAMVYDRNVRNYDSAIESLENMSKKIVGFIR